MNPKFSSSKLKIRYIKLGEGNKWAKECFEKGIIKFGYESGCDEILQTSNKKNWAKVREYRQGENPARWRGPVDKMLPKPTTVKKRINKEKGSNGHHRALPYAEVGTFMGNLRARSGTRWTMIPPNVRQ